MTPATEIIGKSPAARALRATIVRVAPQKLPVLILGPTGAGKEVVARALHRLSGRFGAFVGFNVCAQAESLFEAALFGHVRGAFTSAVSAGEGYLAQADRGTLFLDEIGGLPMVLQAKLLRAIETGEYRAIGANRDRTSDFRVLAAANESIEELVGSSRFREDLAHRLAGVVIRVPALHERKQDIGLLARHFANGKHHGEEPVRLTRSAIRCLEEWEWPGNVRELRQVIDRVIALAGRATISGSDVVTALESGLNRGSGRNAPGSDPLVRILEEFGWDTEKAAEHLGVHRSTVYRRMERLGLFSQVRRARTRSAGMRTENLAALDANLVHTSRTGYNLRE